MSSASLEPMLSGPALSLTAQDFFKCGGPLSTNIFKLVFLTDQDRHEMANGFDYSEYHTRATNRRSQIIAASSKKHANFCFLFHF